MGFRFEELKVWKDAVKFAGEVYALSRGFPGSERFGLISQINRAAVSISLNIAEGSGRDSDAELARYIQISMGSINEVVTVLYISRDLKYINEEEFSEFYGKCAELSKMLRSLRSYLRQ